MKETIKRNILNNCGNVCHIQLNIWNIHFSFSIIFIINMYIYICDELVFWYYWVPLWFGGYLVSFRLTKN